MVYKIYCTENSSQIVSLENYNKVHKLIITLSYCPQGWNFIFWKSSGTKGYYLGQSYFVYNF
jgi:hypothetical protein